MASTNFIDTATIWLHATGYQKLGSFVVSATNVLGGLRRILAEDPGFEALMEEEA